MPPDLALLSALIGSNYPCLELIFMVPKMFEPLKFYCIASLQPPFCECLDELNNFITARAFVTFLRRVKLGSKV